MLFQYLMGENNLAVHIKLIDIKQQKYIFKLFVAGEVAERLKAPLSKSGIL